MMRVLLDTNVILDALLQRVPWQSPILRALCASILCFIPCEGRFGLLQQILTQPTPP